MKPLKVKAIHMPEKHNYAYTFTPDQGATISTYEINASNSQVELGGVTTSTETKMVMDKPSRMQNCFPVKASTVFQTTTDGEPWTSPLDDVENCVAPNVSSETLIGEPETNSEFFTNDPTFYTATTLSRSIGGTKLFTFELTPYSEMLRFYQQSVTQDQTTILTKLGLYALHFGRWRGTLRYTFKFVAPIMTTVKIIAAVEYGHRTSSVPITGVDDAMTLPNLVMEFNSEEREHSIDIPWISDTPWKSNPLKSTAPTDINANILGVLHVYQITPISDKGTEMTAQPKLQAWWCAPQMQFADFLVPDFLQPVPYTRLAAKKKEEYHFVKMQAGPADIFGITANTDTTGKQSTAQTKVTLANTVPPVDLTGLAGKWEQMAVLVINATSTSGTLATYTLPQDFITSHFKYATQACALFRADLSIRIAPNSSSFNAGQCIVAFCPLDINPIITNQPNATMVRLTSLPHAIVDLSSTTPIIFTIPYRDIADAYVSADYRDGGTPRVTGNIFIYQWDFQTPKDGGSNVTLNIQKAWSNFIPMATAHTNSLA